jgi:hypothetical protein
MGLKLSNVPVGKSTRKVFIALDPDDGGVIHQDSEVGAVGWLELQYQSPADISKIMADSYTRVVADAKKRTKSKEFDPQKANKDLCRAAISNWDLTVSSARTLRARFDLTKQKLTDAIEFDNKNVDLLAEHSDLASLVSRIMMDYDFWFPLAESQLGNSSSGPGGSSGDSRAGPASTDT